MSTGDSWLSGGRGKYKSRVKHEKMFLEDKMTGDSHDFALYYDKDLKFLKSALIMDNIIDGDVDDDCQTDNDQKEDSKKMLRTEVANAINKYLQDKRDGTKDMLVKNINIKKRYARPPF